MKMNLFNSRKCKHIKMQSNLIWKQINKNTSNIHSFKQNFVEKEKIVLFSRKIKNSWFPSSLFSSKEKKKKLKTGKTKKINKKI